MNETVEDIADPGPQADSLTRETIDAVLAAVEAEDHEALVALLEPLHVADIADLLEQITRAERRALITLWGVQLDGAVLSELEEGVRDEIIAELPDAILAAAVQDLETDDVVYLAEDMEAPQQERILRALDVADRLAVEQSLLYGEDSAGRLMQREVVVAPQHWTVGNAIDYLRAEEWLPESFYDLIIVNAQMHPIGMVALGRLMGAPRAAPLKELMDEDFRTLRVDQPQEDVAYVFNKYHLISAPVVDGDGRLAGVITIDDAMAVLEEETEEDMRLLAGVGDEELSDTVFEIVRGRFVWLTVNLCTAILAATVIAQFTDAIRGDRRAGRADADRRLDGRQCRHPGADRDGAGAGDPQPERREPAALRPPRGAGGALQRRGLRGADRAPERGLFRRGDARGGDRLRRDRQHDRRGLRRGAGADRAGAARRGPRARLRHLRDHHHRRLRLLRLPRPRRPHPALKRPAARRPAAPERN